MCGGFGAVLSAVAALSACGQTAVVDQAPLGSFFDLRIVNDTTGTVQVTACFRAACRKPLASDTIKPGAYRDEAAWLNASGGVAFVRVAFGGAQLRCFAEPYRKGQEHGVIHISAARACQR